MDKHTGKNRVAVIGGGASGMMAAITAARAGASVMLLEHTDRVGKKILSTGNGSAIIPTDIWMPPVTDPMCRIFPCG